MNVKFIIKNLFVAFFSQGVSLLASFLTTLILPKLISVSDYGLWQLFIFTPLMLEFSILVLMMGCI